MAFQPLENGASNRELRNLPRVNYTKLHTDGKTDVLQGDQMSQFNDIQTEDEGQISALPPSTVEKWSRK